jgi:RNA polymerase sigma-70 factor (ECF subfamily)
MAMVSDEELVAAFREGTESAFNRIVERYKREMYSVAYRISGNHGDADDIVQETFLRAYRALAAFRGGSSLKTWLYRIAVNTSINLLKRRARHAAAALDTHPAQATEGPRGERALLDEELRRRLSAAIGRLPEKQQKTLILKVFQELKFSEIASVMQCSVGTAKANFFHAVRNLRSELEG